MTRGQAGRSIARAELALAAFLAFVVVPALFMAAPASMGPPPPEWQTAVMLGVGAAGLIVGFAWMIRIYRADPEPDQRVWRYREFD